MEHLDLHSFRRSWVTTANRAGISTGVAMRVTGHRDIKVYQSYQRNAQGNDLGEAVSIVNKRRKQEGERSRTLLLA